jgi:hypothetical protein
MKKFLFFIAGAILSTIGALTSYNAAFAEAVTVSDLATFKQYCTDGGDIKLDTDITLTGNTFVKNELSLDLNGHTLNTNGKYFVIASTLNISDGASGGKITGTSNYYFRIGNGGVSGTVILNSGTVGGHNYDIYVADGEFIMNGGEINSNDMPVVLVGGDFTLNDGTITGETGTAVRGNSSDSTFIMNGGKVVTNGDATAVNLSKGSKGTMNGGTIEALYARNESSGGNGVVVYKDGEFTLNNGTIHAYSSALLSNGSIEEGNLSNGSYAKFNINGGTIISDAATAIYAPQFRGTTTITDGTLRGKLSAIELRAGDLTITGGTFIADSETYEVSPNTSGTTMSGAAIAVSQHTTKDEINVFICNGQFSAVTPFSEVNPIGNSEENLAKISIQIDRSCGEPTFNASGDQAVISEDFKGFIRGGTYSTDVTEYVAEGFIEIPRNGMIYVGTPEEAIDDSPETGDNIVFYISGAITFCVATLLAIRVKRR